MDDASCSGSVSAVFVINRTWSPDAVKKVSMSRDQCLAVDFALISSISIVFLDNEDEGIFSGISTTKTNLTSLKIQGSNRQTFYVQDSLTTLVTRGSDPSTSYIQNSSLQNSHTDAGTNGVISDGASQQSRTFKSFSDLSTDSLTTSSSICFHSLVPFSESRALMSSTMVGFFWR